MNDEKKFCPYKNHYNLIIQTLLQEKGNLEMHSKDRTKLGQTKKQYLLKTDFVTRNSHCLDMLIVL